MAQGMFAGCTSYREQSLKDIVEDIEFWKKYSLEINSELKEKVEQSKKNKFWRKVPFNFQQLIYLSISFSENMIFDFDIILRECKADSVTEREVNLLYNIGERAIAINRQYPRDYNEAEERWHKYGDKDFEIVEKMYQHGRDYFITLMDAINASDRLRTYIKKDIVNTNISITQNGDRCQAIGMNNGNITNNIYDSSQINDEIKKAIDEIEKLDELDFECKSQVKDMLKETGKAINANDETRQSFCKRMFNVFKSGGGEKVSKTLEVLSNFATIAAFFGLGIK